MARLDQTERPDLLPAPQCADYDRALARRLTLDEPSPPWLTLPQALIQMDALLAEAAAEQAVFLQEHRAYLAQCLDRAARALHPDAGLTPVVPAPEPAVAMTVEITGGM